jgi:hypothetical protein
MISNYTHFITYDILQSREINQDGHFQIKTVEMGTINNLINTCIIIAQKRAGVSFAIFRVHVNNDFNKIQVQPM